MPLLCTISLAKYDTPDTFQQKHLKPETSTVTAKTARQVSSLVAASIKAPMQAASMSGYGIRAQEVVFATVHKILKDDVNPATCLC